MSHINSPGVRTRKSGGMTIQFARRSAQLEGIAKAFREALRPAPESAHCPDVFPVTIDPGLAHKLRGYCDQIGIIADELAQAGK